MENIDRDNPISAADRELSYTDLAYGACVSLTGEHQIDAVTNLMRVLQSGWIFLVFILGAIYTANLAPVFMTERSFAFPLPDVTSALSMATAMQSEAATTTPTPPMTMCLNEGSANAVSVQYSCLLF